MALRQNWRRDTIWAGERPLRSPREVSAVSRSFATWKVRTTKTLVNNEVMSKETYLQSLGYVETKALLPGSVGHWLPSFQRALLKAAPLLTKLAARKTLNKAARKVIWSLPSDFQSTIGKVWTPFCTYLTVTVLLPLPRTCYLVVCNLEFWVHYFVQYFFL